MIVPSATQDTVPHATPMVLYAKMGGLGHTNVSRVQMGMNLWLGLLCVLRQCV